MTPRAWWLFVVTSIVWGVPYLFIKIAVEAGLHPTFVAWSRIALAALVLLPLALRRHAFRGLSARIGSIAGYAACELAIPFVLIATGERYISSSLTAILIATMPLMVALLALRLSPGDRLTGRRVLGLAIGLGGVVALLGVDVGGRPAELLGATLVLVATLAYAIAPIIVTRRLADLDPLGPVTLGLLLASVALLPPALAHLPVGVPGPATVGAMVALGIVCTALGLVAFFDLVAEVGPNRASVVTYVNPLVAVVLGVLTRGERLGAVSIAGTFCILLGSWMSTAESRA